MSKWIVRTHRDVWEMNERLYAARVSDTGTAEVIVGLTIEQSGHGEFWTDKPMLGSGNFGLGDTDVRAFLQACMDEAWSLGLKPKNFEAPTQELKAVRDHLQDMRKLAKVIP